MDLLARATRESDDRATREKQARELFAKVAKAGDRHGADALKWLDLRSKTVDPGKFACLKVAHISQAWNMCGVASTTMATAFHGKTSDQYLVKKLCGSPMGEGTDWLDLIAAARKVGLHWELKTYPNDEAGLRDGCASMRKWLDSGHPILLDITVEPPDEPPTGHTVLVVGYTDSGDNWIIDNPAAGPPGIEIWDLKTLAKNWHSRWYSARSPGDSRPIILTR